MDKGIIILALNKQSYACAAFNLALSIRYYNPDLNITLLTDNTHLQCFRPEHFAPFNFIKEIPKEEYTDNGMFSPGKAKLSLYKHTPYKCTLYIDADSICFKNLDSLFKQLKGCNFKSNVVEDYTQWTDAVKFKDFFGFEQGLSINSSWIYFESDSVFRQAETFFNKGFNKDDLKQKWGNNLPDELFFNASIQKLKANPRVHFNVMFFDDKKVQKDISEIENEFYFITYYGNANSTRLSYIEWYDKNMFRLCTHYGIEHRFKISAIMVHKHVNTK